MLERADLAERAGRQDQAARLVASVPQGPLRTLFEEAELAEAGGSPDLAAVRAAVRAMPDSGLAIARYARIAASLNSADDRRAADALAQATLWRTADPRVRLVFAGTTGALRATRPPGYAEVLTGRRGPSRIHAAGVLTIVPEDR